MNKERYYIIIFLSLIIYAGINEYEISQLKKNQKLLVKNVKKQNEIHKEFIEIIKIMRKE